MAVAEQSLAVAKWDPFQAMDRLDDAQIVAELEGRVSKALVYQFNQGGQNVQGLSKKGVDAVCREMAKQGEVLRELEMDWQDAGEVVYFKSKVGRYAVRVNDQDGRVSEVLMDTAFGVKAQAKSMQRRDGSTQSDPFWFEKGAMKAARNGKMRLIREDLRQQVIDWGVKGGHIETVAEPAEERAHRGGSREPAPTAREELQRQRAADPQAPAPASTPKAAPPTAGGRPSSEAQHRKMGAVAHAIGATTDQMRAAIKRLYGVDSRADLSSAQASDFIKRLEAVEKGEATLAALIGEDDGGDPLEAARAEVYALAKRAGYPEKDARACADGIDDQEAYERVKEALRKEIEAIPFA